MQKTIEVITIHGVGPHDETFSQPLERNVIAFLEKNGFTSAREIVHFTPVVWSDIGREAKEQLKNKILLPIAGLIELPRTREFILDSVGDILYYLSAEGRKRIKERVRESILQVGRRIREADSLERPWEDWDYWKGLRPEKTQGEWEQREFAYVNIIDRPVQVRLVSSFLPPHAHSVYWRSKKVAREVGLRLLLDYRQPVE